MFRPQHTFLAEIDRLIKDGKGELAVARARQYGRIKFDAIGRAQFSALARRLGQFEFALRLLNPIVRPSARIKSVATTRERVEYAAALSNIGAVAEAIELLESIDSREEPEVLLFKSHAHFSRWEYATAIPVLFQYLSHETLTDYQRLVGTANLAAALVHERDPRAGAILTDLLRTARLGVYRHTEGYALSLMGQKALHENHFPDAREKLNEAQVVLKESGSLELLFIQKWLAIVDLRESGKPSSLQKIREEAKKRRHWETLRSLDYHEAVAQKNEKLMLHVFFGTPYPSLRERLLQEFGFKGDLPEKYVWDAGGHHTKVIDFWDPGEKKLKLGQSSHRIAVALSSDFYRPIRSASLFAQIYPGECYHPVYSPERVKQAIFRLRTSLKKDRVPIKIIYEEGGFRIALPSSSAIAVHRDQMLADSHTVQVALLTKIFSEKDCFTVNDVVEKLSLPLWTAKRLLKKAHDEGILSRQGQSIATKYRLLTNPLKKSA